MSKFNIKLTGLKEIVQLFFFVCLSLLPDGKKERRVLRSLVPITPPQRVAVKQMGPVGDGGGGGRGGGTGGMEARRW